MRIKSQHSPDGENKAYSVFYTTDLQDLTNLQESESTWVQILRVFEQEGQNIRLDWVEFIGIDISTHGLDSVPWLRYLAGVLKNLLDLLPMQMKHQNFPAYCEEGI